MSRTRGNRLPLHQALDELDAWQAHPTAARLKRLGAALERLVTSNQAEGAYIEIATPPLPTLEVGIGSLAGLAADRAKQSAAAYSLHGAGGTLDLGLAWLDAPSAAAAGRAADALEIAFDAAWSRAEARAAADRLAALDAAVRGIATVQAVDTVLQLIVDRVRELSDAQYAALGIIGADGYLERFLTSGIDDQTHARIGALPRGRGLLGLIIREDRSFRIDDIAGDPRRSGFPPHHPAMHSFLGVPVRSEGVSVGNLYLTNKQGAAAFSDADQRLVEMFALHAGIAIDNARLHEEVGRLAVVTERERIGQDLHDGIIQSLYAVALSLEDVPEIIAEKRAEGVARIDRAIDAIHETIRDIRNFILGLEPELLEDADLAAGLRSLVAQFQLNTVTDLELHVDEPLPPLSARTAAHMLAITREALSNIARHAGASRARVELRRLGADGQGDGPALRLIIGDNGRGFDAHATRSEEHHGLTNLKARAESVNGTLELYSERGAGTRVQVEVPLAAAAGVTGQPAQ